MDQNEGMRRAAWKMSGGRCQLCGKIPASQREITFSRNVGMLFQRREYSVRGHMCSRCMHRTFLQYFVLNLCFGWWGAISFWVTTVFFFQNFWNYVMGLFELWKEGHG